MKKIFKIISICFLVSLFSCDDIEGTVYHGNLDDFTLLTFDRSVYDLNVVRDDVGTLEIPFKASVVSPVDRTYTLEFIEDQANPADPSTYDMPTSVTIPANEYFGTIVITGQDLDLVEVDPKLFHFKVNGLNDKEFMDNDTITVRVQEVCPLGAEFTGNYVITALNSGPFGPAFATGAVVTLTATSEFGRQFIGDYVPEAISGYSIDFGFTLSCESVLVQDLTTGLSCNGESPLAIRTGDAYGAYNVDDDTEIVVIFWAEYGDCGAPSGELTFRLTKQ